MDTCRTARQGGHQGHLPPRPLPRDPGGSTHREADHNLSWQAGLLVCVVGANAMSVEEGPGQSLTSGLKVILFLFFQHLVPSFFSWLLI